MAAGDVKCAITSNNAIPCAVFDGVDDSLTRTGINGLVDQTESFTIKAIFRPQTFALTQSAGLLVWGTGVVRMGFTMGCIGNPGQIYSIYGHAGATRYNLTNAAVTSVNTKVEVVTTHASGVDTSIVYVNGASVAIGAPGTSAPACDTDNQLRIGDNNVVGNFNFKGSIYEVMLFKRVLSAAEVLSMYNGTTFKDDSKLIGHWKFQDYNDSSSMANNMTNNGSFLAKDDEAIKTIVKAQRVGANDKWMLFKSEEGQVGSVEIEA